MADPVPFEIVSQGGVRVASNGRLRVCTFENESVAMVKVRAISGLAVRPAAESVIPQLNQLAGELLRKPDTPPEEIRNRLIAMSGTVNVPQPMRHEWLKVTVDDWKIYTDGEQVVVTKNELSP